MLFSKTVNHGHLRLKLTIIVKYKYEHLGPLGKVQTTLGLPVQFAEMIQLARLVMQIQVLQHSQSH